jgi:endo-1,4-beta-xylanase
MSGGFKVPRRRFLAGFASCGLASLSFGTQSDGLPVSLKAAAQSRNLFWGAAIQDGQIQKDADFANLLTQECSVVTPEWEMKWAAIEPKQEKKNFARADVIAKFAAERQLKIRGHTLLWHRSIPDWARDMLKAKSGWDAISTHVEAMLGRYGSDLFIHWDVLNEVIEPKDGRSDGLRLSPFLTAFGPDYIPRALEVAHGAAPGMRLYINEYGLDYDGPVERDRRAALLRLVETLKKSDAPLHGVGIQAHLRLDSSKFSEAALSRFLTELASHQLKITITELDVRERNLNLPLTERDRMVADEVARYLDVVLDQPAVEGVVTWGLSDRYSWLSPEKLTKDGLRNRGLPFDQFLTAKPLKEAIVLALQRRPMR